MNFKRFYIGQVDKSRPCPNHCCFTSQDAANDYFIHCVLIEELYKLLFPLNIIKCIKVINKNKQWTFLVPIFGF